MLEKPKSNVVVGVILVDKKVGTRYIDGSNEVSILPAMPFKKGNLVYRVRGDKVLLDETYIVIDSHNEGDGEYYTIKQVLDKNDDSNVPREVNVEVRSQDNLLAMRVLRQVLTLVSRAFLGTSHRENPKSENVRYEGKHLVSGFG